MSQNDIEENQTGFKGLARLLAYTKPYKLGFIAAFLLLVVATGFEMLSPWLMKIILDDYIATGNFEVAALGMLGGALLMSYVFSAVFQYAQDILFQDQSLKVIHDIRQQVFRALTEIAHEVL